MSSARLLLLAFLIFSQLFFRADAQTQSEPAKELVQYVHEAKSAGLKEAQIRDNATKAGWPDKEIDQAIALDDGSGAKTSNSKPGKTTSHSSPEGSLANNAGTSVEPAAKPASAGVTPPSATSAGNTKPAVVNRGVSDDYRIGEGDVIQISVWGEPTASVPSVVVRPDGKITLPLIKDIQVANLTPAEDEKSITEKLSADIKNADVTVIVTAINSKKVFIVGAVKKEGPISFTYRMTVLQAISEAGGLTDYAKRKKIYVLRTENGREYHLPFDYDAALKGQHMELNIALQSGDTLVVPH